MQHEPARFRDRSRMNAETARRREVEVACDSREGERRFDACEIASGADALTRAEGLVRSGRSLACALRKESIRIEALGVPPDSRVAMNQRKHHADVVVWREDVSTSEHGRRPRSSHEHRCRRVQTEGFVENPTREIERLDLFVRGCSPAEHLVRLRAHAGGELRIACDKV